jgi:endothelin-converting enzyme/putative endopeptidase
VLGTDTALQAQARLFAATPVEHWTSYLAYHWIQNRVDFLPKAFRDAEWAYRRLPSGAAAEPAPRAHVALRFVNTALSGEVGRLYVERHFSPEARTAAVEMTSICGAPSTAASRGRAASTSGRARRRLPNWLR